MDVNMFDDLRRKLFDIVPMTVDYSESVNSLALYINDTINRAQSLYENLGDTSRLAALLDGVDSDMIELRARVSAANS